MKFGVRMFPTDYSIGVVQLAKEAEAHGFESLWFPEHLHIPASRQSPYPAGGPLPKEYSHTLDLFVALSAAAAVTTTLKVGSGICLVVERDPIQLAKEVASLDHLSGGRFLFGIGGGWNREEMENHGTNYKTRWSLLRERVEAMKRIWAEDEATYHGRFVNFDRIWSWPKPVQRPHPPILMGGSGPTTFQRVVQFADAWMPIAGRNERNIVEQVHELNELAAAAGRRPIPVSIFGGRATGETIEHYQKAGVERIIFGLPPGEPADVLPLLEQTARLVESYRVRA